MGKHGSETVDSTPSFTMSFRVGSDSRTRTPNSRNTANQNGAQSYVDMQKGSPMTGPRPASAA